jgi:CRISPR/Cas system endoribonuclease Cas6 (RAMP superfamily)
MDLESLEKEVSLYIDTLNVMVDGENLWDNMQEVTAIAVRLQQIHNEISMLEYRNEASPELRKFRTMVLDPTTDRFDKVAAFESRKMAAKKMQWEMER